MTGHSCSLQMQFIHSAHSGSVSQNVPNGFSGPHLAILAINFGKHPSIGLVPSRKTVDGPFPCFPGCNNALSLYSKTAETEREEPSIIGSINRATFVLVYHRWPFPQIFRKKETLFFSRLGLYLFSPFGEQGSLAASNRKSANFWV